MNRLGLAVRGGAPALVAIAAGLCAAAIELLPAGNPARAAAALLLVLALPGVALLGASGSSRPLGQVEVRAWQVGLSIAATILVTLALDGAGVKLELGSWTLALTGVTALACAIWALRAPVAATATATARPRLRRPPAPALRALPAVAITLVLLGAAVAVTTHSVSRSTAASRFTQLWILPANGAGSRVRIGIDNHEGHTQTYALQVRRGGRELVSLPAVRLGAGASWTRLASIPRGAGRVDVTLRRGGAGGPVYREVYLTPSAASSSRP